MPSQEQADAFLPPFETENKLDPSHPRNLAFSAGPDHNTLFKYREHLGVLNARQAVKEAEEKFASIFGRRYPGLVEAYRTEDAALEWYLQAAEAGSEEAAQAVERLEQEQAATSDNAAGD